MDPTSFVDHTLGRPIKTPGRHGFYAYHPAPLPRSLPLDEATVKQLSDADNALGRLAGAGRLLRNPHLLATPYILKEAVASSRIEGTRASISDVFDASAIGGEVSEPVREVQNYVAAMHEGLRLLETLPPSLRLIRTIHKVLLIDVRGSERMPESSGQPPTGSDLRMIDQIRPCSSRRPPMSWPRRCRTGRDSFMTTRRCRN